MHSVLVIGMSTLGRSLALKMREMGSSVMIADKDESVIQSLSFEFPDAVTGDCTNESVLRAMGVNNFDCCFVALGEDSYASLEITSMLKELGAKYVVVRAKRLRQAEFLHKIGADEVFFPEKEIAEKLALRYTARNIFDYIELTRDYSIFELPILHEWLDKSISQLNIRTHYNINIIAVKNAGVMQPAPGGEYIFLPGDHVVVIGRSRDVLPLAAKAEPDGSQKR